MLVADDGKSADVQVSVVDLRLVGGGRVAALAEVELVIGGIGLNLRGVQLTPSGDGRAVVMPQYRAHDGRWRTAVFFPPFVVAALEARVLGYWSGVANAAAEAPAHEGAASVSCAVVDLRAITHPRIIAEAAIELVIDAVPILIEGVQLIYTLKHKKEQKATLRFPHYKAVDGTWRPIIDLPEETLTPIWQLFLDTCVEAGVLDEHQLEFS